MKTLRTLWTLSVLTCGCCVPVGQEGHSVKPKPIETLTLVLPRQLKSDEALHALVTVGKLARGDMIVVRTKSGEIAGSIVMADVRSGQNGGVFPIPVPRDAVEGDRVVLNFEVVARNSASEVRAPNDKEVESVKLELTLIPAP